jgi:hypothetical protein
MESYTVITTAHITKSYLKPKHASYRESIVNSIKAGLLTCNISTILPISLMKQWTYYGQKLFMLLTVARQFVIYTRFPINLQLSKTIIG